MKRLLIQVILVLIAAFLAYEIYDTVRTPVDFGKEKDKLYESVIENLKQIRKAELAFKDVNERFTGSWDSLLAFITYDSIPVVRKIGSLTDSMIDAGWTEEKALEKGKIIRDTLRVAVIDTLFGKTFAVEQLQFIPNTENEKFFLGATEVVTGSGVKVHVFEARAHNNRVLAKLMGEYEQEIVNLNEKRRVDGKYPGLKVGSLIEANNNSGNWE
jgi:hypothetical protein